MSRGPLPAKLLAACAVLFVASGALAQQGSSPKRAVVVTFVGAGDAQPALEASLAELLARHHLTMNPGGEVTAESVLARVQIDMTSQAQAVLLITDGHTGEVRALRTIPRGASTAITREEIAHAVQSAVESGLIVDEEPPPAPPAPAPVAAAAPVAVIEAPPPREQPASVPRAPSWFALDLTTLAGAGGFASGTGPDVHVGGGVVLGSRAGLRPSVAVTALYTLPFQSQGPVVGSQTNLVSLRAIPAIEVFHTRWLAIDAGAGGGIDVLSVSPRSGTLPANYIAPSTSRVDPIVAGVVTAQAALATGVVLVLSAGADVDLATRRYVFDQAGADQSVLAPWRVRPTALAGLAFTALGEGLFAARSGTTAPGTPSGGEP